MKDTKKLLDSFQLYLHDEYGESITDGAINTFLKRKEKEENRIYQNNAVEITYKKHDADEARIDVNGKNLIWISTEHQDKFKKDLLEVLDNYRI